MTLHPTLARVTDRIRERSLASRAAYLARIVAAKGEGPARAHLSCGNQAHAYAAMATDKPALTAARVPNIGVVTAYNDMLSAHQPYEHYPELIRATARRLGATAQVAGGALLLQEHAKRHQLSLGDCPDLKQRIASRNYLIATEAEDLIAVRQALLDDATAQGMEASEQGFARSRFRAIRNARDMAIHARDVRLARLDGLTEALADARYDEYKFLVMTLE